jgi:2'-5' RNA ligase
VTTEETAVLIPVPEAEPAVRDIRSALDPAAARGIPAHVTLLYPFVPPDRVTPEVLERVRTTLGAVAPFDATLTEAGWFDDSVLWLRPEPTARFADLTARLSRAFPEYPPYGGAFNGTVPHLTIGQDLPLEQLTAAAEKIPARLPITFRVQRAVLMAGVPDDGPWTVRSEFPLGTVAP